MIICATDFSENSISALRYAYNMSLKINTKLLVIHIFDYPIILDSKVEKSSQDLRQDSINEYEAKLKEFCEISLGDDLEKMNVAVEAIINRSTVDGIVSKAKEIQSLLIVTGMKGMSKLRTLIMGSTAAKLIEEAPYPVLTIPEDANYKEINTIVYATDFQEQDLGAINRLVEIAKPLQAKIKIVHVSPSKEIVEDGEKLVIEEKLNKYVKYNNMELHILYSDDIFNELKLFFGKMNADIIAMLERESTNYGKELFYQNLHKKMKTYGRIPLMSFNAKNYGMFRL